jgi:hypothetical protein
MFNSFREKNALMGSDAWYCAFNHPDAGLRGALAVTYPMATSGQITDRPGFELLLDHCLTSACGEDVQVDEDTQVLVSYKMEFEPADLKIYTNVLFDQLNVASMCLLNEPVLAAAGYGENSCIIVDVGARSTRAVPVFENYAMKHCARTTPVGGEHATELLEQLIDAQGLENYSSALPRRRQQFARHVKEKHGFVASSFDDAVNRYGQFTFDYSKVMATAGDKQLRCKSSSSTPHTTDIQVSESFVLTDGSSMNIRVDRELFYCTEVLFAPFLHEPVQDEPSIADTILACVDAVDASVREEVCRNIILGGKSSLLHGLGPRLETELRRGLKDRGVAEFSIVVGEDATIPPSLVWGGAEVYVGDMDTNPATEEDVKVVPTGNIITSHAYSKGGVNALSEVS